VVGEFGVGGFQTEGPKPCLGSAVPGFGERGSK